MRRIAFGAAGILVGLAALLLWRAGQLTSRQIEVQPVALDPVSADEVASRLAQAVRLRTVSHSDPERVEPEEFLALHRFLADTYPETHRALQRETVNELGLLYTWVGSDSRLDPFLLMAHQDVVPVPEGALAEWSQPPYDGAIADGFVWGRGTMDDKGNLIAILEAVERLVQSGFTPRRTLLLAFGHDEEVGGLQGAAATAELLEQRGVRLDLVVDEGAIVAEGLLPGVEGPVALIGIAEKGYLNAELLVRTPGGHSSMPPPHTGLGILAGAIQRIEGAPMPARIDGVTLLLLDTLAPEMSLPVRAVLGNLWLFGPVVIGQLEENRVGNATIRTSTAVTMAEGSPKENVLPSTARAIVNHRLLPGDSIEEVLAHDRAAIGDPRVEVSAVGYRREASPISNVDGPQFEMLARSIREVFGDVMVAPNLVIGGTDARNFYGLSANVYRFAPFRFTRDDMTRPHGIDERIAVDGLGPAVQFYMRLIRNAAG